MDETRKRIVSTTLAMATGLAATMIAVSAAAVVRVPLIHKHDFRK